MNINFSHQVINTDIKYQHENSYSYILICEKSNQLRILRLSILSYREII